MSSNSVEVGLPRYIFVHAFQRPGRVAFLSIILAACSPGASDEERSGRTSPRYSNSASLTGWSWRGGVAALSDSSVLVRRLALGYLGQARAVQSVPYIIPFLKSADDPSRFASVSALSNFGPAAREHMAAVDEIALGDDPVAAAAALRVRSSVGSLEQRHVARLLRILDSKIPQPPVQIVDGTGKSGWVADTDKATSAYTNALWALGTLGPHGRGYADDVRAFLTKLDEDDAFRGHIFQSDGDVFGAGLFALGKFGPENVPAIREIMRRGDATCEKFTEGVFEAGLPPGIVDREILKPLMADAEYTKFCVPALVRSWPSLMARYWRNPGEHSPLRVESLFTSWYLQAARPDSIMRGLLMLQQSTWRNAAGVRSAAPARDDEAVLFEDKALLRAAESVLVAAYQSGHPNERASAALALSRIGRLPAGTVERLLHDADTATSPIPPHNHLFQLLLERRHFTPPAERLATRAIEYDLSPLRGALSPPALLLAAMGSGEPGQIASLLELTERQFVVANPNALIGRSRGEFWRPFSMQQMLVDSTHIATLRFLAYATAPDDLLLWVRWVGRGGTAPKPQELSAIAGPTSLKALLLGWDACEKAPGVRLETGLLIADLARYARWGPEDIDGLKAAEQRLRRAKMENEADVVAARVQQISVPDHSRAMRAALSAVGLHALFWLILIALYPRSALVQSWFFWSPFTRQIAGGGYVNLLLVWNPYLRRRLFSPFRVALAGEASASPEVISYKEGVEVIRRPEHTRIAIEAALPAIRGHVILEGASGLGKTMYLRRLVSRAQRPTVYLPAYRCGDGVVAAIKGKLPGFVGDETYLLRLLHAGALDVCIDGLNEVSAEVRVHILRFMEASPRANVIIATQPLDWGGNRPNTILEIQPLGRQQITAFLVATMRETAAEGEDLAVQEGICTGYLDEVFSADLGDEVRATMLGVLSNPMDLTEVATLLAAGKKPNLFQLRKQQYEVMAEEYARVHQGSRFPLRAVAETALAMRLADNPVLPWGDFPEAITIMAEHKFVVRKELSISSAGPEPRYQFRHEKIADYFVACSFTASSDNRMSEHIGDPRFRGVYLTLALTLPLDAAEKLERALVVRAAQDGDHSLSDPYVRMVELRRRLANAVTVGIGSFAAGAQTEEARV